MLTTERLKKELDADQFAAVTAPAGNILCIANAGSGKTRVLTYRIAYMIDQGEPESSFMMLTFTVKAAKEMMDRIKGLLGRDHLSIVGGTFHSVAFSFIKRYPNITNFGPKAAVMDDHDSKALMGVAREFYYSSHEVGAKKDIPEKEKIYSAHSYCRNTGLSLSNYNDEFGTFTPDEFDMAEAIIKDYEKRKRAAELLDFDDLLLTFDRMLNDNRFLAIVRRSFPNLFVDEYQDINAVQASIIKKMVKAGSRLTAVGDDAQCIYGFRGSDVKYIMNFKYDFPEARVYPIRNNYRSDGGVIDLAVSVINESPYYKLEPKQMFSTHPAGMTPKYHYFDEEQGQADYIVSQIKDAHDRGIPYDEIAILVRANRLPRPLEVALNNAKIPLSMECGIPFYDRKHVRYFLDFVKFIYNPANELAFWNIFETVSGVGPGTSKKLFDAFSEHGNKIDSLVQLHVGKKSKDDFNDLLDSIFAAERLLTNGKSETGGSLTQQVLDVFMFNYGDKLLPRVFDTDEVPSRKKDIQILRDALAPYDDIADFLESAALSVEKDNKGAAGMVRMLTIHKAKGLEWDKVFLPYVVNGILPAGDDLEEERRLTYVAITRARKELDIIAVGDIITRPYLFGERSPFFCGQARQVLDEGNGQATVSAETTPPVEAEPKRKPWQFWKK